MHSLAARTVGIYSDEITQRKARQHRDRYRSQNREVEGGQPGLSLARLCNDLGIQARPTLPTSTSFEHLAALRFSGALFGLAYPIIAFSAMHCHAVDH
jgi:hypothetical protein